MEMEATVRTRITRRHVQTAHPCYYADFMKCQPLNFKGTEGVVGLTLWIEKMESVFNISGCFREAYTITWEVPEKDDGQVLSASVDPDMYQICFANETEKVDKEQHWTS
ncbi:hypothetical protein Tco_0189237 [Tanacetum coccineum]